MDGSYSLFSGSKFALPVVSFSLLLFASPFRLTQTLTHTGKYLCGNNGLKTAKDYLWAERKGSKTTKKLHAELPSAAHNPKVVGSNPAPATMKNPVFKPLLALALDFLFPFESGGAGL